MKFTTVITSLLCLAAAPLALAEDDVTSTATTTITKTLIRVNSVTPTPTPSSSMVTVPATATSTPLSRASSTTSAVAAASSTGAAVNLGAGVPAALCRRGLSLSSWARPCNWSAMRRGAFMQAALNYIGSIVLLEPSLYSMNVALSLLASRSSSAEPGIYTLFTSFLLLFFLDFLFLSVSWRTHSGEETVLRFSNTPVLFFA